METTKTFVVRIGAQPSIGRLDPAAGRRGATVTVTGTGFGAVRGTSTVKFGTVAVTTAAGASNAKGFTVKR